MALSTPIPYGAWPSPLTAAAVARGTVRLSSPRLVGAEVWWGEGRPEEGGRSVVVRRDAAGAVHDLLPAGWSARSRVHEYGGVSWLPVDGALVFANWADQRVYRVAPGGEPEPLTPEPPAPAAWRYADPVLAPGGGGLVGPRGPHLRPGGAITRSLVSVPLDGSLSVRELVGGSDFLASPRASPDGARVAWLAWDHPRMPWDGTELRVGVLGPAGAVEDVRTVLGGAAESVLQPEWADADTLYAVTDRTGWWNLHRVPVDGGRPAIRCRCARGRRSSAGRCGSSARARTRCSATAGCGPARHRHATRSACSTRPPAADRPRPAVHVWQPALSVAGDTGGRGGGRAGRPRRRWCWSTSRPAPRPCCAPRWPTRRTRPTCRQPEAVTVPGPGERDVHAHVYPPRSPAAVGPGRRAAAVRGLRARRADRALARRCSTWRRRTSPAAGIGVVDVNYGGSTGYGRAYRERLRAAVGHRRRGGLRRRGAGAGARRAGRRGAARRSAAARPAAGPRWPRSPRTDVFAAGASHYGVAELIAFAAETHDFESRYIDGLVGTLPAGPRTCTSSGRRCSHVDRLSCPVLLLQGLEDKVVPPAQAELFVAALERKGIPYAYLAFAGEQHGFRRAETIMAALEAELSFYGQVFGFTPPGVPVLPLSREPVRPRALSPVARLVLSR